MPVSYTIERRIELEPLLDTPPCIVFVAKLEDGRRVGVKLPVQQEMLDDPLFDVDSWQKQMEPTIREMITELLENEQ